jgi:prepilin peptidase CpaA
MMSYLFLLVVFPFLMVYAMLSDLRTMLIPNWISLSLVVAFFLFIPFSPLSWGQIGFYMLTSFGMLVVCFGAFTRGWIGGGDAKLIPATVLWLGPPALMSYLILASLFGLVLLAGVLAWRHLLPMPAFLKNYDWLMRLRNPHESLPYGVALGASALVTCTESLLWTLSLGA